MAPGRLEPGGCRELIDRIHALQGVAVGQLLLMHSERQAPTLRAAPTVGIERKQHVNAPADAVALAHERTAVCQKEIGVDAGLIVHALDARTAHAWHLEDVDDIEDIMIRDDDGSQGLCRVERSKRPVLVVIGVKRDGRMKLVRLL